MKRDLRRWQFAVKERKKLAGQLGPPLSIVPHVLSAILLNLSIGPVVVWVIQSNWEPTRAEWQRIASEAPSEVWRKMVRF